MPWFSLRRLLGRPTLRPGRRGQPVELLQHRLRALGYDPGPVDGVYGHQTAEAVRDLQRDFRLRVDGIAGPQVLAVLGDPGLLRLRRTFTVAHGQSLAEAARALDVSPPLLRRALGLSRRGRLAPGQRVVLWERLVAAEIKPGPGQAAGLRALGRWGALVSAAAVVAGGGPEDDPAAGEAVAAAASLGMPVWVTLHTRRGPALLPGSYDVSCAQRLVHARGEGDRLVQQVKAWTAVPGVAGVHVDLGGLRFGDGPRWLALLRRVSHLLRSAGRQLIVSVPLRDLRGLWARASNDVHWEALAGLVAQLVLVPPILAEKARPPRPLSPPELAARLRAVARRVPLWRCLLALPMGALMVPVTGDTPALAPGAVPATVSYPRALSLAYRARTRPRWDEEAGRPVFACPGDEQAWIVWPESRDSLARKLDLVEALRLGGVYWSALGEEDVRVWATLQERWKVHKPTAE